MSRRQFSQKLRYMCLLAMFIAIELIFKLTGLGNIPINPMLNVTLMNIPVAIGAILLGPLAGLILGIAFGLTSFIQPMSGMIATLFGIDAFRTIIMCVATRALMGFGCACIFRGLKKIDRTRTVSYFVSALSAALLNTALFMGALILFFYGTDYVQGLVANKGAVNPFNFIILMVGFNGLLEAAVTMVIGGGVSKGVDSALNRKTERRKHIDRKRDEE